MADQPRSHSTNHAHEHHHGHGDHAHHHPHHGKPALIRSHAHPEAPHFSLMRLSSAQRAGWAALLCVLLWTLVWWAVQ